VEKISDIKDYSPSKGDVTIGSECWICAKALIDSGVTNGNGAIVGAGALVERYVAPYSVVAVNPLILIRSRLDLFFRDMLFQTAWWDWP
ncbi:antibiotic acetyltransferase, partial [Pseudomonas syringae pv. tagetis]